MKRIYLMIICCGLWMTSQTVATDSFLDEVRGFRTLGLLRGFLVQRFLEHRLHHRHQTNKPMHTMLGSQGIKNLSDAEKASLQESYNQGKAILVLHPEQKETILETFKFLEKRYPCPFAHDSNNVDMYVLLKTPKGIRQETFLRGAYAYIKGNNEKDTPNLTLQPYESKEDEGRVFYFTQWLETLTKSQPTASTNPPKLMLAATPTAEPQNLLDLADQITDVVNYPDIKPGGKSGGYFQITTLTVPASVRDGKGDIYYYFYVGQQCHFTPPPLNNINNEGLLTGYRVGATVPLYPNASPANPVNLIVESPTTTEGQTSVSSSVSYNIGGNVGFFGETVTGGLSGGASYSKSVNYSIPDITIIDQSSKPLSYPIQLTVDGQKVAFSTRENNPFWEFKIKLESNSAKSTFEPFVQWLWRVPKTCIQGQSNLPVNTQLFVGTTRLESTSKEPMIHPKEHWTGNINHVILIPFPPDPIS